MNKSRLSLVISLAALLSGGLLLPNAASAHDYHDSYQSERQHQRSEHRDHQQRHIDDHWYLQRHREVRYYDERPMKRRHKHGHKHGHKHAHKVQRHHHRDAHRDVRRVYQPVPVELEYRRISPLRLEIGYEIVL